MKFLNYIKEELLQEKISKKELEIALQNNNIYVGGEFEFKCHEMQEVDFYDDYENASRAYKIFIDEWDDYENEREELELSMAEKSDKISEIDEQHDDLIDEIDKLEEDIESFKEGKEIYNLDSYFLISKKITDISTNEEILQALEYELEAFNDKIEDIKSELEDLDEERDDLQKEYEDVAYPFPDNDYLSYVEEVMGYSRMYVEDRIFSWEGDIPEPQEPERILGTEDGWLEVAERVLPDILTSAPFDEYEIAGYDDVKQKIGDTVWAVEYDSSISDNGGVEIKSPPLPLKEFLDVCPKMFKWIGKHGTTDDECGFHIHVSIKGIPNLEGHMDFTKLLLFTDEEKIYKFFDTRKGNHYCISKKDKEKRTVEDLKGIVDSSKIYKWSTDHYDAINFQNIKDGHIEFRYMGGMYYHKKWDVIRKIIGSYSYVMSLAIDDSYKRKEYITKAIRILNRKVASKWFYAINSYVIAYYGNRKENDPIVKQKIKLIDRLIDKYREYYLPYKDKILPWNREWANVITNYGDDIIKDINKKLKIEEV